MRAFGLSVTDEFDLTDDTETTKNTTIKGQAKAKATLLIRVEGGEDIRLDFNNTPKRVK